VTGLSALVAAELAAPVDARVAAFAEHLGMQYPGAARAVLFYGSCLRSAQLEGQMLDFYLIVSDYRQAYGKRWLAIANRLVPPNVFPIEHDGLQAKYAVLSEADFMRECSNRARSVSVWARFAQPARLVWAADEAARERVIAAVSEAAPTLFQLTLPMMPPATDRTPLDVWRKGFELTYGAELRAERNDRPGAIVDADPERYDRFGTAALAVITSRTGDRPHGEAPRLKSAKAMPKHWRRLRRTGKALTLLRLAKASATYAGGVDYLAWKINRHAGTRIELKPWQRRWPLLGALTLLPRLLLRGAIR